MTTILFKNKVAKKTKETEPDPSLDTSAYTADLDSSNPLRESASLKSFGELSPTYSLSGEIVQSR
jgi:hypothetical protein